MSNADRIARLETRYDEAIAELDRVNATEPYDNDAAGDAHFRVTEAYAKLGAAESTTDFLRGGWENGPASCRKAIAEELRIRNREVA